MSSSRQCSSASIEKVNRIAEDLSISDSDAPLIVFSNVKRPNVDAVEREIGFNCMWQSFVFILINTFRLAFKY